MARSGLFLYASHEVCAISVPVNTFKTAISTGRKQIGLWQALATPYTAEICAGAGFDWLLFDGEHAPNTVPGLLSQLQAIAPYPVHPVARPPVGDTHLIKQYLDIGFTTLLIPLVETPEQAQQLVRATRYAPAGVRGVGSAIARASRWNRIAGYLEGADSEICLLVQIESLAGLENLESIAQIDGVDGVFIGPSDLSAALGHRGDPGHPDVQDVIDKAIARILKCGKAVGILTADHELAARYLKAGCSFVAVGTDVVLLARAAEALAKQFVE
jgi:4-hydroxy-2-oxoheptanedioate aldolase